MEIFLILLFVSFVGYRWYSSDKDVKERKKAAQIVAASIAAKKKEYLEIKGEYDLALSTGDLGKIVSHGKTLVKNTSIISNDLGEIYADALNLLKDNPDLKPHVLEIGRKKYAFNRPDKAPTVYDEAAINNDIMAALK
ncbi:MAG: hypothetical protein H7246_15615 [Phycisphaerae bacterium]|nr:hypothetical protein [Saprospiraceae bacterium]